MYKVVFSKTFKKNYKKRVPKNFDTKFKDIFQVLVKWPPFLKHYNVHILHWKYDNYFSINLSWDFRIIFSIDKENNLIYLLDVWTHSQLYK